MSRAPIGACELQRFGKIFCDFFWPSFWDSFSPFGQARQEGEEEVGCDPGRAAVEVVFGVQFHQVKAADARIRSAAGDRRLSLADGLAGVRQRTDAAALGASE